jgi:hypothetical protein
MLARFAFWPLAFVGARALNVGDARIVAFAIILGSLVASSITRARSRRRTGAWHGCLDQWPKRATTLIAEHLSRRG